LAISWIPGEEISNGLRRLGDDQTCLYMSQCISERGVAEVFVQMYKPREIVDDQVQSFACSKGMNDQSIKAFHSSPIKTSQEEDKDESESEGDEDYLQGEEDTSKSDKEANQFKTMHVY